VGPSVNRFPARILGEHPGRIADADQAMKKARREAGFL
jgi:hypothetical protein